MLNWIEEDSKNPLTGRLVKHVRTMDNDLSIVISHMHIPIPKFQTDGYMASIKKMTPVGFEPHTTYIGPNNTQKVWNDFSEPPPMDWIVTNLHPSLEDAKDAIELYVQKGKLN